MDQSHPPRVFVVFPGRRAVHHRRPNRTDIRVPIPSMPAYLPAPHHPTPAVDIIDYGVNDNLTDKDNLCTAYLNISV